MRACEPVPPRVRWHHLLGSRPNLTRQFNDRAFLEQFQWHRGLLNRPDLLIFLPEIPYLHTKPNLARMVPCVLLALYY